MGILELFVARSLCGMAGRGRAFCFAGSGGDAKRVTGRLDALLRGVQNRLRHRERVAAAHCLSLLRHRRGQGLGLCLRSIEDRANEIDDKLPWGLIVIVNDKLQIDCLGGRIAQGNGSLPSLLQINTICVRLHELLTT